MKNGIIAFCGSKGSGKSTSATIFTGLYKGPTEELAFAGHLKNSCSKVFDVEMKYFLDPALKEVELDSYVNLTRQNLEALMKEFQVEAYDYDKHIRPHVGQVFDTPRRLLQYIGTEVLHPIDPLIHVKITLKLKDPNKLSIVTDLRFMQEFKALADREDFVGVYVYNMAAENRAASDGHASEKGVFEFKDQCILLPNNGSMIELENYLKSLIEMEYGE